MAPVNIADDYFKRSPSNSTPLPAESVRGHDCSPATDIVWVEKEPIQVAQIIPLGFVTANNAPLTANVPAPAGFPLRCNKVLVQAYTTANATDYVFVGLTGVNKTTGANVIAVLQAGQSVVVGDERDSNVIDPTSLAVDSSSSSAVITGLLYQR